MKSNGKRKGFFSQKICIHKMILRSTSILLWSVTSIPESQQQPDIWSTNAVESTSEQLRSSRKKRRRWARVHSNTLGYEFVYTKLEINTKIQGLGQAEGRTWAWYHHRYCSLEVRGLHCIKRMFNKMQNHLRPPNTMWPSLTPLAIVISSRTWSQVYLTDFDESYKGSHSLRDFPSRLRCLGCGLRYWWIRGRHLQEWSNPRTCSARSNLGCETTHRCMQQGLHLYILDRINIHYLLRWTPPSHHSLRPVMRKSRMRCQTSSRRLATIRPLSHSFPSPDSMATTCWSRRTGCHGSKDGPLNARRAMPTGRLCWKLWMQLFRHQGQPTSHYAFHFRTSTRSEVLQKD